MSDTEKTIGFIIRERGQIIPISGHALFVVEKILYMFHIKPQNK
jgi:hypothetical protein